MELTIREAATVLGISERAVRSRIRRGTLDARKRDGRWVLARHRLPLTAEQRKRLHAKADALRDAVEDALPDAAKQRPAHHLADLDVFRFARDLLDDLPGEPGGDGRPSPRALIRAGLDEIGAAHFEFDRTAKLAALRRARASVSRAVVALHLIGDEVDGVRERVELRLLPRLAGLVRWAESLPAAI